MPEVSPARAPKAALRLLATVAVGGTLTCGVASADTHGHVPALQLAQATGGVAPTASDAGGSGLDSDALFDLLVGELSARDGDTASAARSYLSAAQRTRDADVAERATRLALFARDFKSALTAARLWTELDPENDEAMQANASLLLHLDDDAAEQAAFALFDRHAVTSRDSAYARVGEVLARGGNRERADAIMEALVERNGSEPRARLALARYYARTERYVEAVESLDAYLSDSPDDASAIALKAELLRRQDKADEALALLAESVDRLPEERALAIAYARVLTNAGRFDEARAQYEKVLEATPDDADSRYALAAVLVQSEDLVAAREQFEKLTEDANRRFTAFYFLGQIAEEEGRLDDALAAYRRVDRGEQRMSAQMRIAQVLSGQGKIEQARAHLHGLRGRTDEESINLVRAEGEVLSRGKRYEDAMSVYDSALEKHAKNADLLYARAMVAEKLDRIDLLERDLRQIIADEPEHADALNALGYTLADRTDRLAEAEELIRKAVKLRPDSHYIIDSLGWVLYRQGKLEESVGYLRRAMELQPDAEIAAHLGEVLWMLGERDEARTVWDAALELKPDDETLLDTRQRFGL